MKIIVKNSNIKDADAFLFGIKGLSINESLITLDELKNMDANKIFISLDKNMENSDLDFLEEVLKELELLNIKGILFYDIAVLSLSKKFGLKTPLIWNQNFLVTNYKTCGYYKKEGVSGAVVSSEITIDEICEIRKNTSLDLFVNIFGYNMMAFSKRKLVSNYFDYIKEIDSKKVHYMIEKDIEYPIIEQEFGTKMYSNYIFNGIRYLERLKYIDYIILDGNMIEADNFKKIYDIFKEAISNFDLLEEKEKQINKIVPTDLGFLNKKTIYKVKRK